MQHAGGGTPMSAVGSSPMGSPMAQTPGGGYPGGHPDPQQTPSPFHQHVQQPPFQSPIPGHSPAHMQQMQQAPSTPQPVSGAVQQHPQQAVSPYQQQQRMIMTTHAGMPGQVAPPPPGYGYPGAQQWPQPQQAMPGTHYVGQARPMGAVPPGQRVMIQRVPYPNAGAYVQPTGLVPGGMPQAAPAAAYGTMRVPPGYPQGEGTPPVQGAPPPGYGFAPHPQAAPQLPPGYPQPPPGQAFPPGAYQRQPMPQQNPQMRQYVQVQQPQQQPRMMPAQVYPNPPLTPQQSSIVLPQQQQQQHLPQAHTPQTPFTPNGGRFASSATSSPLAGNAACQQQPPGTPQQQQQQQPLPPDMRSPPLMSPTQAPLAPGAAPMPGMAPPPPAPQAIIMPRQISNGDMAGVQQQGGPPQGQPLAPHPVTPGTPGGMRIASVPPPQFYTRDPSLQQVKPEMCLIGCVIHILDWDRFSTERTDFPQLMALVKLLGGDVDVAAKTYESKRNVVTHVVVSHLFGHRERMMTEWVLSAVKDRKRVVTLQWLIDCVERRRLDVPTRLAHLPSTAPPEVLRAHAGRVVAMAGFDEASGERGAVRYMLEAIGTKVAPYVAPHVYVLVAKGPCEMVDRARELDVPVVTYQWLADIYVGQMRYDLEHPRYQLPPGGAAAGSRSTTPGTPGMHGVAAPMEVTCGPYVLDCMHEQYKLCMHAWRYPIQLMEETWQRACEMQNQLQMDERIFPNKRIKLHSSAAPSEAEIETRLQEQPPSAAATAIRCAFEGFDEEATDILKRKIRYLGVSVTSSVSDCTHLVAVNGRRTMRLLEAISRGKNVVGPAWITISYDAKSIADTYDFFLRDDEVEKQFSFSFKMSVLRARHQRVFRDCEFCITPSVEPSVEEIKFLIECNGGTVFTQPPSPKKLVSCIERDSPFIFISSECDLPLLKYVTECQFTIYNVELVLVAVLRQELEPHPCFQLQLPLPPPGTAPPPAPSTPAPASASGRGGGGAPARRQTVSGAEFASLAVTPRVKAST